MGRQAQGLWAWTLQRVTAVYLILFSIYLLGVLVVCPPASSLEWREWVANPFHSLGFMLFVLVMLVHAWIGIRDVLIDYVPILGLRLALLSMFALGLLTIGFWTLTILIGVMA